MSYPVYYHLGDNMDLRSEVHRGTFSIEEEELVIDGEPGFRCHFREVIQPAQYYRLHFLCRMLEIQTRQGTLFVTVSLVQMFGRPVVTNFQALEKLQADLDPRVRRAWVRESTYQTTE